MSEPDSEPLSTPTEYAAISGGAKVAASRDARVGGDVTGRDKILSAGRDIVTAGEGSIVIVEAPRSEPSRAQGRWLGLGLIGLVLVGVAGGLIILSGNTQLNVSEPMKLIAAGSFVMGSDLPSAMPDARPAHQVDLDAYWIDQYEVTNAQYRDFVMRTHHAVPKYWQESGGYPTGRDTTPVVEVSWSDADAYCRFVSKRLPTEAEWEKAARGDDQRLYPWGDTWTADRANAARTNGSVQPVGSYEAGRSPYGVDDLAGNIWEWVSDWYDPEYYASSPTHAPAGPKIGETKIVRGGAWTDAPDLVRAFTRLGVFPPHYASQVIGFRCACTDCRNR